MPDQASYTLESSYTKFLEFLLLSKHKMFELAAEYGLTGMQAAALCLLDKPCPMSKLSKLFNCDPSNITGIVDGLEQKGLASRFTEEKDRRVKMVELKPEGRDIRTGLIDTLCGQAGFISQKLTRKELAQFTILITKITE